MESIETGRAGSLRLGQNEQKIIFFLNRHGYVTPTPSVQPKNSLETSSRFEIDFSVLPASSNGNSLSNRIFSFRFDNNNPSELVRAMLDPQKIALCLSDPKFELKAQWFQVLIEKQSSIGSATDHPETDTLGRQALLATLKLLNHIARKTSSIVRDLNEYRFELDGYSFSFLASAHDKEALDKEAGDKSSDGPESDNLDLLHRWWLFTQYACRALANQPEDITSLQNSGFSARQIEKCLSCLLKLRAHLAAHLIESRSGNSWRKDHLRRKTLSDYHDSMIEWIDYNLNKRDIGEDLLGLNSRYRELGDLLFECNSANTWLARTLRFARSREAQPMPASANSWSTTPHLQIRKAFRVPWSAFDPRDRKLKTILDAQWRILQATERFFYSRHEIPEFMALSRAAADVSREWSRFQKVHRDWRRDSGSKSEPQASAILFRASEPLRYLMRNLPWPYALFLLLCSVSWLALGSDLVTTEIDRPSEALKVTADVLFGAQYVLLFGGLIAAMVLAITKFRRIHSLFEQAMPDILGGILFGYLYLSFAEEMWLVPLSMRWSLVLLLTLILVSVACLSLVVEVAARARRRDDMLRKAASLSVIALIQSYAIGLLLTTLLGPSFMIRGESGPPVQISSIQSAVGRSPMPRTGDFRAAETRHFKAPGQLHLAPQRFSPNKRVLGVDEGGNRERCRLRLESEGKMRIIDLGFFEFWFFPKLLLFWSGLALFIGIFVQSLTERMKRPITDHRIH